MDDTISEAKINQAFAAVRQARLNMYNAAETLRDATRKLKDWEATCVVAGIEGKNAEQQAANLRQVTNGARAELDAATEAHEWAKCEFEMAGDSIVELQALLQFRAEGE